jgi:hypothetical protein
VALAGKKRVAHALPVRQGQQDGPPGFGSSLSGQGSFGSERVKHKIADSGTVLGPCEPAGARPTGNGRFGCLPRKDGIDNLDRCRNARTRCHRAPLSTVLLQASGT